MSNRPIWKEGIAFSTDKKATNLTVADDKTFDVLLYRYEIASLISYHLSLSSTGIINKDTSKSILKTLSELYFNVPFDLGNSEDVHSFVEESFIRVNNKAGPYLRTLLSRNDQSHTDIRLFTIDNLLELRMKLLKASLEVKSVTIDDSMIMPGFTHYRQAMPLSWLTYLDHVASVLLEEAGKILTVIEDLKELPLGYGSGFGSDVQLDWEEVANYLGMIKSVANPFHVASFRSLDEMRILDLLKEIMLRLSRISQDLIMWSSDDVGFIHLPLEYVTGSSLMPNKRNPDFLEMLEGYASQVLSDSLFTSEELISKSSGYHRDFQISKWKVMTSIKLVSQIVEYFGDLIKGIEFDRTRAKEILLNSSFATGYAANLVSSGVPWKEAYSRVGSMIVNKTSVPEYKIRSYENAKKEVIERELEETQTEIDDRNQRYSLLIKKAASME